uniref:Uncharacterized protein n=1 Tax=Ananas comosus var. bracteatus TaxID=296719 RepID=A0A6V7QHJ2_ANACO|nr:unnamed protein product [Ananas comosus var. bracteatus]
MKQPSLGIFAARDQSQVGETGPREPPSRAEEISRSETGPCLRDRSSGDRSRPRDRFSRATFSRLSRFSASDHFSHAGDRSFTARDRLHQEFPAIIASGTGLSYQGPVPRAKLYKCRFFTDTLADYS